MYYYFNLFILSKQYNLGVSQGKPNISGSAPFQYLLGTYVFLTFGWGYVIIPIKLFFY